MIAATGALLWQRPVFPTLILFPVLAFATDYNRHHCLPNGRIPLTVSGKFSGSGSGEIT
jgi:hypothetical protein